MCVDVYIHALYVVQLFYYNVDVIEERIGGRRTSLFPALPRSPERSSDVCVGSSDLCFPALCKHCSVSSCSVQCEEMYWEKVILGLSFASLNVKQVLNCIHSVLNKVLKVLHRIS